MSLTTSAIVDAPSIDAIVEPPQYVTSKTLLTFLEWAVRRAQVAVGKGSIARRSLRFHDLDVTLLSDNRHYLDVACKRLCSDVRSGTNDDEITVAVVSPEDSDMPAPPAWGEPIYHPREIENLLNHTRFRASYFRDDNLWHIYDSASRFGVQWMQTTDAYPPWECGAPLRVFLHWAYALQAKRLVHAGTLGTGGRGILLVGKGGSGKSGTVVGGIARGLESVGDDYVLVDLADGGPRAFPVFRTLKQDLAGLIRLGLDSMTAGRTPNWQDKYELRIEDFAGRTLTPQFDIGGLVLPKITGGSCSTFAPLNRSRAMLALAPSGLMQMPGERETGVDFFARLVRQVPCFELSLSTDSSEITSVISAFIERDFTCD